MTKTTQTVQASLAPMHPVLVRFCQHKFPTEPQPVVSGVVLMSSVLSEVLRLLGCVAAGELSRTFFLSPFLSLQSSCLAFP